MKSVKRKLIEIIIINYKKNNAKNTDKANKNECMYSISTRLKRRALKRLDTLIG